MDHGLAFGIALSIGSGVIRWNTQWNKYATVQITNSENSKAIKKIFAGLTSWGMVKYGYANNIQRMVERAKYDHLYMGNMNLLIDIKIIIYTIKTVLSGRGQ